MHPCAPRTAISRRRLSERTSSRLDTLTQAITSSNAAPASRDQQNGANVADDHLAQRLDHGALAAIGIGILLLQLRRDRLNLSLSLLDRDAVLQSADTRQAVTASPQVALAFWM